MATYEQKYEELQTELKVIEVRTGLYLADTNIDAENCTGERNTEEWFREMYFAACMAAGMRAEEAGCDINQLIGRSIY